MKIMTDGGMNTVNNNSKYNGNSEILMHRPTENYI
jgi:hypothetical protein